MNFFKWNASSVFEDVLLLLFAKAKKDRGTQSNPDIFPRKNEKPSFSVSNWKQKNIACALFKYHSNMGDQQKSSQNKKGVLLKWWVFPTTIGYWVFPLNVIILGCFGVPPFKEAPIY